MISEPIDRETFEAIEDLYVRVHSKLDREYVTRYQMQQACRRYGLNATETESVLNKRERLI